MISPLLRWTRLGATLWMACGSDTSKHTHACNEIDNYLKDGEQELARRIAVFPAGADTTRKMLQRWTAMYEANFQIWVAAGLLSARTLQARDHMSQNLKEEISEDHNSMLRDTSIACNAEPDIAVHRDLYGLVRETRNLVSRGIIASNTPGAPALAPSVATAAFLTVFEAGPGRLAVRNAQKLAASLGSPCDQERYFDIHTTADVEHGHLMQAALCAEVGEELATGQAERELLRVARQSVELGVLVWSTVFGDKTAVNLSVPISTDQQVENEL